MARGNLGQSAVAPYSSKPTGMGMGQAISRTLVEEHGGSLWCARNENGGETFSFTLPT